MIGSIKFYANESQWKYTKWRTFSPHSKYVCEYVCVLEKPWKESKRVYEKSPRVH